MLFLFWQAESCSPSLLLCSFLQVKATAKTSIYPPYSYRTQQAQLLQLLQTVHKNIMALVLRLVASIYVVSAVGY
jgi:hypothetical protein